MGLFCGPTSGRKGGEGIASVLGAGGHVIARLLQELPENIQVPASLPEKAKVLDNFYILARYPNSHPLGAPFEHYGPLQSEAAITYAGEILTFVRAQMAG